MDGRGGKEQMGLGKRLQAQGKERKVGKQTALTPGTLCPPHPVQLRGHLQTLNNHPTHVCMPSRSSCWGRVGNERGHHDQTRAVWLRGRHGVPVAPGELIPSSSTLILPSRSTQPTPHACSRLQPARCPSRRGGPPGASSLPGPSLGELGARSAPGGQETSCSGPAPTLWSPRAQG